MRLLDLFEAASSILYHSTSLYNAAKILETKRFNLAASAGTSAEVEHQPKGTYYFLSTTRSKIGDYTLKSFYADGVVINLNGQWLNNRYKAKPIDYWGRDWNKDEMEDRVFSRKPVLPLPKDATDLITAIHVLFRQEKLHSDDLRPYFLRKLLLNAKLLQIPIYVYNNPEKWLAQDTSKAIDPRTLVSYPEKNMPSKPYQSRLKDYLKVWRELYFKNDRKTISPEAKKILYSIQFDMYKKDEINSLSAEIHNVKTKNNEGLIKLLKIFKELNIQTAKQYVDYLADKWDKIED